MSKPTEKTTPAKLTPDEVISKQRNRELIYIVVVVAVLAGLVAISRLTRDTETVALEVQLVSVEDGEPEFETKDVDKIQIWQKDGGSVELKRKGTTDDWSVQTRWGALADSYQVKDLLNKVAGAKRLNRASVTDESSFVVYSLSEEFGIHLKFSGDGKELIHLLIGKGDSEFRDFVRLLGEDQPEGIFELTERGAGGRTLRDLLQLENEEPDSAQWLDLSRYTGLPRKAEVGSIVIHDGEQVIELTHEPDPELEDEKARFWRMHRPRAGRGSKVVVSGAIEAIRGMRGRDVAGRPEDRGLGVAGTEREVEIEYAEDDRTYTLRIYFGKVDDNRVAVHVKTENSGEFVWWVDHYVVKRVFRELSEYIGAEPVGALAEKTNVVGLKLTDGQSIIDITQVPDEANPDEKLWKVRLEKETVGGRKENIERALSTIRKLQALLVESADEADPKPDFTDSSRIIEVQSLPADGSALKTLKLTFGNIGENGTVALQVAKPGGEVSVWWAKESFAAALFRDVWTYRSPVRVRWILITHRDAVAVTKGDRSRDEAETLANGVLAELEADPKRFDDLQKKHNEEVVPDVTIELVPRDANDRRFQGIATALTLNQIKMCESLEGFLIVKRVE